MTHSEREPNPRLVGSAKFTLPPCECTEKRGVIDLSPRHECEFSNAPEREI